MSTFRNIFKTSIIILLISAGGSLISKPHTVEAAGNTYYVRVGGGGTNCTQARTDSQGSAYSSINAAVRCLSAGDTLLVHGGAYDESILNSQTVSVIPSGTSWSNKVRIAAYPNGCASSCETVWMKPSHVLAVGVGVIWLVTNSRYIEFDGINMDASLLGYDGGAVFGAGSTDSSVPLPDHIRIQNAELIRGLTDPSCVTSSCGETDAIGFGGHGSHGIIGGNEARNLKIHGGNGAVGYGVYLSGPNNLVENCDIYDTSSAGVHIYNNIGDGDTADNNIVRNNHIHNLTTSGQDRGWGILVAGNNNLVYNNVIDHVLMSGAQAGIYVYSGSGNKIYNNTIVNNAADGISIYSGGSDTIVQNNIAYANPGNNYINGGPNTTESNNLFGTDPRFTSSSDYHLLSTSPAINAGTNISAFTTDITGAARVGVYDIGAYEYTGGSSGFTPSPSGTRIPSASSITDNAGAVWTLGSGTTPNIVILRNGSQANGAFGAQILWYNNILYIQGDDLNWYQWNGSSFNFLGSNDPGGLTPLAGDLNLDHIVNSLDWSVMNSKWFTTDANADLNHDGLVNAIDFSTLNANWFKTW